jgi:hypothetical protein
VLAVGLWDMRPAFAPVQIPDSHPRHSVFEGEFIFAFAFGYSLPNFSHVFLCEDGVIVLGAAKRVNSAERVKSVLGILRGCDGLKVA